MSKPESVRGGSLEEEPDSKEDEGGYKPSRSEAMVDFPEPEEPTIAVQRPPGMLRLRSESAQLSGRDG